MTEPDRDPDGPAPSIGPTRPLTLLLAFAVAGVAAYLLVSRFYGDISVPLLPVFMFAVLAVIEGVLARATKARIERRPGTEPMPPLSAARMIVLAKASSLAGAIFAGLYAGALLYVLSVADQLRAAAAEVPIAGGGVVTAALLAGAALWLERSCRIPPADDDDKPRD
ncbi:DUF3180 domain-containing protein [Fodinicola acaciae]|uniref:DUF3180 domain-containing protein n=1 Tax=Fodinicola acaciae TaxID=2681555 RepID=UPI0013D02735|nr:DUF3180 domain-containing protein [Fodinicola acaciae]